MEKNRKEYHVRSVQRALRILDCFNNANPYLGVTQISEMLKIHKSTIHALLVTLEDEGFIAKNEEKNKYFPTYKLFSLGNVVSGNISIKAAAAPFMQKLCEEVNENVALNITVQRKRLILEVCETAAPIKLLLRPGQILSLHSNAAGKILLAGMSDEEVDDVIREEGLEAMTPNTITDEAILKQQIKEAREKGYALCKGESYWLGSVGTPVWDYTEKIIASLCIYGPMQNFEGDQLDWYITKCKEYGDKISRVMGYKRSVSTI
ncbi:MAG: IclR family transcriptional regulator [Synergistaceae bacterium]|jgi:DNA-binding IclR family transcriptional regulator|nr:IclR family transcriptional regulator [Synergistaceae bacterium]